MSKVDYDYSLPKYLAAAILLGAIEGVVTFYFLNAVSCSSVGTALFNDPLALAPYILVMAVVAIVTLWLIAQDTGINSALFGIFLLLWLLIGMGGYFAISQGCGYLI